MAERDCPLSWSAPATLLDQSDLLPSGAPNLPGSGYPGSAQHPDSLAGKCSKRGCANMPCTGPWTTLLHRARIVNRFLDFLVWEALIVSNPIADLRAEYCVKSSKAILRALLTPDPDQALAALRQFPPFGSVLGDLMRDHIALMRTRGFRYDTKTRMFLRFNRFLQSAP